MHSRIAPAALVMLVDRRSPSTSTVSGVEKGKVMKRIPIEKMQMPMTVRLRAIPDYGDDGQHNERNDEKAGVAPEVLYI